MAIEHISFHDDPPPGHCVRERFAVPLRNSARPSLSNAIRQQNRTVEKNVKKRLQSANSSGGTSLYHNGKLVWIQFCSATPLSVTGSVLSSQESADGTHFCMYAPTACTSGMRNVCGIAYHGLYVQAHTCNRQLLMPFLFIFVLLNSFHFIR